MSKKESKKFKIYAALFPNEKVYIGQTTRKLKYRQNQHRSSAKRNKWPFYNAIRKYGWSNIKWRVLFRTSSQEELDYVEQWYIKEFDTTNITNGYNLKSGGEGGKLHQKTKDKLSKIFSGENSNTAKLDWTIVREIREKFLKEKPQIQDLAKDFQISRRQIGRILRNQDWIDKNYKAPEFKKYLTEEAIIEIRSAYDKEQCLKNLAKKFNITVKHAKEIGKRKNWQKV